MTKTSTNLDRCFEIAGSQAEQLNQPTLNWVQTFGRASRALVAGDPDGAEQLATEALQIGTNGGEPDVATVFGPQLIGVHFERGTLGDFIAIIEQNVAEFPGVPAFVAALALAHVEADDPDAARPLLEEFECKGFEIPIDIVWLTAMALYAEAAIECGDPAFARPMLERLAPWEDRLIYDAGTSAGPVSHYLGGLAAVLGRSDEAERFFEQSSNFSERVGAKWFAARTELSWGRMLAERRGPGDAENARNLLNKAHSAAATHGYRTVERRALSTLRSLDA